MQQQPEALVNVMLTQQDMNTLQQIFDIALKHERLGGVAINVAVVMLQQKFSRAIEAYQKTLLSGGEVNDRNPRYQSPRDVEAAPVKNGGAKDHHPIHKPDLGKVGKDGNP